MKPIAIAVVICGLLVCASVSAYWLRPDTKVTQADPGFILADIVPKKFGDWVEEPEKTAHVVNPQTQEMLNRLYSQIVSRTYVHPNGYRIMLSLAFGEDQRGQLAAHKPEVCYPAQGFQLHTNVEDTLKTPMGPIAVRRLTTTLGERKEPVTYWFTVGDTAIRNRFEQRMVQMRMGLTGQIPGGLIFRVSSIDGDVARAMKYQDLFVNQLLQTVPVKDQTRLAGLKTGQS